MRALHEQGRLTRVFCTETRPYNQGSRLTAFELLHDRVPATLIADSAAAAAMRDRGVQGQRGGGVVGGTETGRGWAGDPLTLALSPAVVVGADRVAANGDTANKIGTYQLAVAARHHGIPFYVAAPTSSCDPALPGGADIPIEERPGQELTHFQGLCLAPQGGCCVRPRSPPSPEGSSGSGGASGVTPGSPCHQGAGGSSGGPPYRAGVSPGGVPVPPRVLTGPGGSHMRHRGPYGSGGSHMGWLGRSYIT